MARPFMHGVVCVDISIDSRVVVLFSLFRPRRSADATSALTPDSVLCAQLYRVSAALSRCARSQAPSEPARILDGSATWRVLAAAPPQGARRRPGPACARWRAGRTRLGRSSWRRARESVARAWSGGLAREEPARGSRPRRSHLRPAPPPRARRGASWPASSVLRSRSKGGPAAPWPARSLDETQRARRGTAGGQQTPPPPPRPPPRTRPRQPRRPSRRRAALRAHSLLAALPRSHVPSPRRRRRGR
mmetsp:Transcript_12352/g.40961  ORF Transcript_12352/g.40961 Transcript_12352/m.40961 type:complete len:247 (+) Transcript_12352:639-1379(+)